MCRRNQKLANCQKASEAVLNVVQSRAVPSVKIVAPVSIATDSQDVAATPDVVDYVTGELGRTDSGSTDDARKNSCLESVKARADGNGFSVSGVNPLPELQTVTTSVASSSDSVSPCMSSEVSSAEKIERLRRMIDRAAGQLYTIAEVYLMMLKPQRVPLEYDWVDTSVSSVSVDDVSGKLQKLVSIARAAFTASSVKPRVNLNINDGSCSDYVIFVLVC